MLMRMLVLDRARNTPLPRGDLHKFSPVTSQNIPEPDVGPSSGQVYQIWFDRLVSPGLTVISKIKINIFK